MKRVFKQNFGSGSIEEEALSDMIFYLLIIIFQLQNAIMITKAQ